MLIYISACGRLFGYSAWLRQFPTGSSCQAHGIWSFCHSPTCWTNPPQKGWLAPLARSWKTFDGILCFFQYSRFNKSVQNLHAVNAVLASCQIRKLLWRKHDTIIQVCFHRLSVWRCFINGAAKEKSTVHSATSLRHIILPIVCDMVKHVCSLSSCRLSNMRIAAMVIFCEAIRRCSQFFLTYYRLHQHVHCAGSRSQLRSVLCSDMPQGNGLEYTLPCGWPHLQVAEHILAVVW